MTNSLWVPICMVALWGAFISGSEWAFVGVSTVSTVWLTLVIQHAKHAYDRNMGQLKWDGWTIEELLADVTSEGDNKDMPLYMAGVGYGILPVTDWYTARIDGRLVVILEHLQGVAE
jgi:hypothetical protein